MYPEKQIFNDDSYSFWSKQINEDFLIRYEQEFLVKIKEKYKTKKLILLGSFIKYSDKKFINFDQAYVELFYESNLDLAGLRITKNNESIEIYGELQEWFETMKKYVVQVNFIKKFKIVKKLGHGTTGTVYKIKQRFYNTTHAAKIISKSNLLKNSSDFQQLKREIQILKIIKHPNLVEFQELYETDQHVVLIFEYLSGGELSDIIESQTLQENDVKKVIKPLIIAINYLHEQKIFHRDIKPQNILLRNCEDIESVCIVDFGLAEFWNEEGKYNYCRCGTPGFVAPELLQDKKYNLSIDVYSLGVLIYLMLTKRLPFQSQVHEELIMKNFYGIVDFSILKQSNNCIDLLQQMLTNDYNSRISAQEVLNHDFFNPELKIQNNFKIRLYNIQKLKNLKLSPRGVGNSSNSGLETTAQSNEISPQTPRTPYKLNKNYQSDQNDPSPLSSSRKSLFQRKSKFEKFQKKII